jgi:uncharacterized protein (DUF305 family)
MQEMQWPDGGLTKEFFTDKEMKSGDMEKSRKQLEALGAKLNRVAYVTKYVPHQGAKEMARRVRQMASASSDEVEHG